jgi:hypothetical protein
MNQRQFNRFLERDGYRCYHCGTTETLVPQHRINRGMGGNRLLLLRPSNIITVCSDINGRVEADADLAEKARDFGWKLRGNQDPEGHAVFDVAAEAWFYLNDDFTRKQVVWLAKDPCPNCGRQTGRCDHDGEWECNCCWCNREDRGA